MARRLLIFGKNFPGFAAGLLCISPSSMALLSRLLRQRMVFCTVFGDCLLPKHWEANAFTLSRVTSCTVNPLSSGKMDRSSNLR